MEQNLEPIRSKIYEIRGQRVMLDRDLAELYGVTTGNLNKAVKRNIRRFPPDFMFQLTKEEFYGLNRNLIFQNGISSWGGTRKLPYAFTQPGFPEDFMFQLTKEEYNSLRCHFGTSNRRGGDRRALPYAFTEQGLAMLSGILDAISEALAELQPREPKSRRRIGFIQEE